MAFLTRHQTDKVGVFYILGKQRAKSKSPSGEAVPTEKADKIYYIMYRLDGKKVEEKVGRDSEHMTIAKAAKIREQRINGVTLSNTERRRQRIEKARAEAGRGALLGLQWDDLDFEKGYIVLRREEAKSGKTTQIPMTSAARIVLEGITPTESKYLFPGKGGGKRVEIKRFMQRVRQQAGLPSDFRPLHGLRHTYASWLASSGKVDLFTLQKLMTHGSPQMTQRYAHLADEAVKRAASVIDECLDVAVNAQHSEGK